MFYKALFFFFVILILLFGCLIFTVYDRHHRPILCSKLTARWTCERETDCPRLHELVKDYEIQHCGRDEHESKICCPPHTHHDHDETPEKIPQFNTNYFPSDPVTIVRQKCREYAEYSLINKIINILRPVGEKPIQYRVHDCKTVQPLVLGLSAAEEEFPHMALLGFGETVEDAEYLCGGTLISEQFILTAAHCTRSKKQANGSWAMLRSLSRLDANFDKLGENVFRIVQHINHPDYDDAEKRNDIALYRLEEPIKLTSHIRPVCLATTDTMEVSANSTTNDKIEASVVGWGTTGPGFPLSDFLLKATVHVLNDDTCELDPVYRDFYASEKMICAGNLGTHQDTCYGDSGGPLQVPNPDMKCMWTQIGITTRGRLECGNGPAIYTKVAHYIPWIQKIVWP